MRRLRGSAFTLFWRVLLAMDFRPVPRIPAFFFERGERALAFRIELRVLCPRLVFAALWLDLRFAVI